MVNSRPHPRVSFPSSSPYRIHATAGSPMRTREEAYTAPISFRVSRRFSNSNTLLPRWATIVAFPSPRQTTRPHPHHISNQTPLLTLSKVNHHHGIPHSITSSPLTTLKGSKAGSRKPCTPPPPQTSPSPLRASQEAEP